MADRIVAMKSLGLVVLWLFGSGLAISIAWAGVQVVDDQIIDPAPASDIASAIAETSGGSAGAADVGATNVATAQATSTSSTSSATSTSVVAPQTTEAPPTTVPVTTSTTAPPSTATTAPPTTTTPTTNTTAPPTTTATTAATAQVITFHLVGGKTAISFSSADVSVLWATPNPGFEVRVEPESPGIKVEFRADQHRSRIDAWWSGGPQHEIREEPD